MVTTESMSTQETADDIVQIEIFTLTPRNYVFDGNYHIKISNLRTRFGNETEMLNDSETQASIIVLEFLAVPVGAQFHFNLSTASLYDGIKC